MIRITGILFVAMICVLSSCFKVDDYYNLDSDDVLKFISIEGKADADGVNSVLVKVQISDKADFSKRDVMFVTNLGLFDNVNDTVTVAANDDFIAEVWLSSVRAGTATVLAFAGGIKANGSAKPVFSKIGPDNIVVTVDSFQVHNDFRSEVLISATMGKSNGGKPSAKHRVDFTVKDSNGNDIGMFLNGLNYGFSDNDGKVKVRFAAGSNVPPGTAFITARTVTTNSDTIEAQTIVFINN